MYYLDRIIIFIVLQISERFMTEQYMLSITLSEKAYEHYRKIAAWKKIPVGTLPGFLIIFFKN